MKTYELEFDVGALKEWHKLDGSIRGAIQEATSQTVAGPARSVCQIARRDHDEVYLVASITTNSLTASHTDSYISAVSYMEMAQGCLC